MKFEQHFNLGERLTKANLSSKTRKLIKDFGNRMTPRQIILNDINLDKRDPIFTKRSKKGDNREENLREKAVKDLKAALRVGEESGDYRLRRETVATSNIVSSLVK